MLIRIILQVIKLRKITRLCRFNCVVDTRPLKYKNNTSELKTAKSNEQRKMKKRLSEMLASKDKHLVISLHFDHGMEYLLLFYLFL